MKLLLIMCTADRSDEVRKIIDDHEVHGYTEIPEARGAGETGRRLGTRAFPGSVTLVFTAVSDDKAAELVAALRALCEACDPGETVRAFVLEASEAI